LYSGNERFPRQPSPVPEVPASRDQPFGPVQHPEILRGRNQLRREPAELDRDPASDDRHYFFEEKSGLRNLLSQLGETGGPWNRSLRYVGLFQHENLQRFTGQFFIVLFDLFQYENLQRFTLYNDLKVSFTSFWVLFSNVKFYNNFKVPYHIFGWSISIQKYTMI
jgi:hypothetical protein